MNFEKPNINTNFSEKEQLGKKSEWGKKMAEVNEIVDILGKGIDEKIKESVGAFLVHKFTTSGSCEGHITEKGEKQQGSPYPWIEIYTPEPEGREKAKGAEKKKIEQKWLIENLNQQKKMMGLLEEFYKERETPFDARLTFDKTGRFGGFRVQSFGGQMMPLFNIEKKRQKLALYQKEMKDFTNFLKKKYFENS